VPHHVRKLLWTENKAACIGSMSFQELCTMWLQLLKP